MLGVRPYVVTWWWILTGYVVSLRTTGLGDRIVSLCAAWIFARNTGRTLIVDWRRSTYSKSGSNLFPACFANRTEIAGVPLIAELDFDTSGLPRPIYPPVWNAGMIAAPWLAKGDGPPDERQSAVALIRSGGNVAAPTVVFRACINDGIVSFDDARQFLQGLRPAAPIEANVESFRHSRYSARHLDSPWIGLHIRHGNGGNILGHARSWQSFPEAVQRCGLAVEEARRHLGDAPVLLCTDSVDVERAVRKAIPGVTCRPKTYRRSGRGELHSGRAAPGGLNDALTEMLLLAGCKALIRYPAASFFSFYAAVTKPRSTPAPASVYDLQSPWDPADPLSPALLL